MKRLWSKQPVSAVAATQKPGAEAYKDSIRLCHEPKPTRVKGRKAECRSKNGRARQRPKAEEREFSGFPDCARTAASASRRSWAGFSRAAAWPLRGHVGGGVLPTAGLWP
mmetsp:Transcript_15989/g.56869  ORF Transcript_15989/g.56869 Transcript_15989/m.56869 type:complete len:110 (+) Transcript_15989:3527-3856(+)